MPDLWRRVLAVCSVLVGILAGFAGSAYALVPDPDFYKSTQFTRDATTQFFYGQSPQTAPPASGVVEAAEDITREAARTAPPSSPGTGQVVSQARTVTARAGLMPAVRALGVIGLAVGSFELGWKIGTGLNTKLLRIGLPPPPQPKTQAAAGTLVFHDEGWVGNFTDAPLPEPGWVLQYPAYQQQWTAVNINRGWDDACAFLQASPSGFQALLGTSPIGWCDADPLTVTYWLPEDALAAYLIKDYVDQPYDVSSPAPAAPPVSTVEATIEDELDDPSNETLRDFLNYHLGSPASQDPLGVGPDRPDIRFPDVWEHWWIHHHEFGDLYDDDPMKYWEDAADIVERGDDGDLAIQTCTASDGTTYYWDESAEAIVSVRDGVIKTYFKPDDGFDYFDEQCNG